MRLIASWGLPYEEEVVEIEDEKHGVSRKNGFVAFRLFRVDVPQLGFNPPSRAMLDLKLTDEVVVGRCKCGDRIDDESHEGRRRSRLVSRKSWGC